MSSRSVGGPWSQEVIALGTEAQVLSEAVCPSGPLEPKVSAEGKGPRSQALAERPYLLTSSPGHLQAPGKNQCS